MNAAIDAFRFFQFNPKCPFCGHPKYYSLKNKWFKCKYCSEKYNVLTDTVAQGTKLSFQLWLDLIHLSVSIGITSVDAAQKLDIQQRTAWFMIQRIKNHISEDFFDQKCKRYRNEKPLKILLPFDKALKKCFTPPLENREHFKIRKIQRKFEKDNFNGNY